MKKIYLLMILVFCTLLVPHSGRTQGFAPLGAEWTYRGVYGGPYGEEDLIQYKCIQADTLTDKIIKTLSWSYARQNLTYTSGSGNNPLVSNRDTTTGILQVYEQNDTVWVYNTVFGKYTPLYVFNVQEGDTLRLPILDIDPAGPNVTPESDSVFVMVIDSIRTVNYGGIAAQTYFVTNYLGDTATIDWDVMGGNMDLPNPLFNWTTGINFQFVEGDSGIPRSLYTAKGAYTRLFGGVGEGLLPRRFYVPPANIIWEGEHRKNTIQCFANDTLSFKVSTYVGCDTFQYNRTTALKDLSALKGVAIYPNPANNDILLQAQQPFATHTSLTVIDLLGRTILDKTSVAGRQQYTIPVTGWNTGTYILILESEGQRYYRKVQVVH